MEQIPQTYPELLVWLSDQEPILFTSESVSSGHPDKLSDQISDAILDEELSAWNAAGAPPEHTPRVAVETLCTTNFLCIAGEVTTAFPVDYEAIARRVAAEIGYDGRFPGFDASTCEVLVRIDPQSPDISVGVSADADADKDVGAGDQGLMFGYACRETEELMPLSHSLARNVLSVLRSYAVRPEFAWLGPDAKSQVTLEYHEHGAPERVHTVVVSTQHAANVAQPEIEAFIRRHVLPAAIPENLLDERTIVLVNPTGVFITGGPQGDCGLTGRKIIVDTYGGHGAHGGGAFSGKDPTKVDRSAAYMARYIAKNLVFAGLADRCQVQLAYAIGVSAPVSVHVKSFGTSRFDDRVLGFIVRRLFPLTPAGIIRHFGLLNPQGWSYRETASSGHFGPSHFPWERTDKLREIIELLAQLPTPSS